MKVREKKLSTLSTGNLPAAKHIVPILAKISRIPVLKRPKLFTQIFIISYMRLKLRSLSLLDPKNMPKPIPHCSNFRKIIFLKNGQSYILSTTGPMDNGHFLATVQWRWSCSFTLTLLFMWRGVTWHYHKPIIFKDGFVIAD